MLDRQPKLTAAGRPVGLQLVGPWDAGDMLLDVAEMVEAAFALDREPEFGA